MTPAPARGPRSVWLRPERLGRDRRLSRDAIVSAAIGILDAEGASGLSMRRVSSQLAVTAGALYWHVATKDELLELASDQVTGEVDLPGLSVGADGDWRAALTEIAVSHRAMLLRHPWVLDIAGTHANIGPNAVRLTETMLQIMDQAGFDPDLASVAVGALGNQISGSVAAQAAWQQVTAGPAGTLADWQRDASAYLSALKERYPLVGTRLSAPQPDPAAVSEERFRVALDCLLDGLSARRAARP
jgi:AcrR family transcriptional regulator